MTLRVIASAFVPVISSEARNLVPKGKISQSRGSFEMTRTPRTLPSVALSFPRKRGSRTRRRHSHGAALGYGTRGSAGVGLKGASWRPSVELSFPRKRESRGLPMEIPPSEGMTQRCSLFTTRPHMEPRVRGNRLSPVVPYVLDPSPFF